MSYTFESVPANFIGHPAEVPETKPVDKYADFTITLSSLKTTPLEGYLTDGRIVVHYKGLDYYEDLICSNHPRRLSTNLARALRIARKRALGPFTNVDFWTTG